MRYLSSILSASLGNILEWYDFGLFTIFSSLFSRLFFPNADPHVALIAMVGIFSVGFLCRPIGSLIFGYMGDRSGRARTLRLSILMITLPTLLIGCLPTYKQIGLLAPILLMVIRIWQGISIGGEYSGNIIYLAEISPKNYRATFTALASTGANIGVLLAALVGIFATGVFTEEALVNYGWRLPYLISGLICLLIYRFRLQIHESTVFEYLKRKKQLVTNPIKTALKTNYLQILRTFGLVCMGSTFYYFCFIYIPLFLTQKLHFSVHNVSVLIASCIGSMIILVPLAGLICDKFGRRKMFLFNSLWIAIAVVIGFHFLQTDNIPTVLFVLALFTLASSAEQGVTSITVVENFPLPARYTGLSLGYNLGNGLLGGTVPIICEWLSQHSALTLAPALYVAVCAVISGLVVYFFVPETRGKSLQELPR